MNKNLGNIVQSAFFAILVIVVNTFAIILIPIVGRDIDVLNCLQINTQTSALLKCTVAEFFECVTSCT